MTALKLPDGVAGVGRDDSDEDNGQYAAGQMLEYALTPWRDIVRNQP